MNNEEAIRLLRRLADDLEAGRLRAEEVGVQNDIGQVQRISSVMVGNHPTGRQTYTLVVVNPETERRYYEALARDSVFR